jgi:hypothetical protein
MSSWLIALLFAAVFGTVGVVAYRRSSRGLAVADDRPWWRRAWDGLLEAFSAEPAAAEIPVPAPADLPPMPAPPPPPPPQASQPVPAANGDGRPPAEPQPMGGAQADLLHSITSLVNRASQGDIRDVRRAIKTLAVAADHLGGGVSHLGRRLAEPDKHYGAEIWEPLTTAGAQLRSGALHMGYSDANVSSLLRSTVGEIASSPRTAPHHSQLNGPV